LGTKGTGQNYNRWELESECSVIMLLVEITNGFESDASRENLGWRGELKDIFVLQMGLKHIQDPLCISSNFSSCQGASKTRSIQDVRVPAELRHICKWSLKGDKSLLDD
jgi:hypothetical protein